jgi:hypothetical protein
MPMPKTATVPGIIPGQRPRPRLRAAAKKPARRRINNPFAVDTQRGRSGALVQPSGLDDGPNPFR